MHIRRRGIHGARQGAARGTRCRDGGGAPSGEADRDRGSDAMWDCGAASRPAVPCDCERKKQREPEGLIVIRVLMHMMLHTALLLG